MPRQSPQPRPPSGHADSLHERLLDAAADVMAAHGYDGLTLERLARSAATSRMTLHRRGITVDAVVAAMSGRAADELRDALFPFLVSGDSARARLDGALRAMFDVADRHLPVLAALFAGDDAVFHAEPDDSGARPTGDVFVAPFTKLLADGAADGTLREQPDADEAAVVLFNMAGWCYVHLRHTQRWPVERARDGVVRLVIDGLAAASSAPGPDRDA